MLKAWDNSKYFLIPPEIYLQKQGRPRKEIVFYFYTKAPNKLFRSLVCLMNFSPINLPRKPTAFLTPPTETYSETGWGMGVVFEGPKLCQLSI